MDFWDSILTFLLIVAGLALGFFVLFKKALPLCTGFWMLIRRFTDFFLIPLHALGRLFKKKEPQPSQSTVMPPWSRIPTTEERRAEELKKKREARLAPWGGVKSIVVMSVCLAFVVFTVLYNVIGSVSQETSDGFWMEFAFSFPTLSFMAIFDPEMAGTDLGVAGAFSISALLELPLFNILSVLVMRHIGNDNSDTDSNKKSTFYEDYFEIDWETLTSRRNPYDAPRYVYILITGLYDIIFTLFYVSVMFWLPPLEMTLDLVPSVVGDFLAAIPPLAVIFVILVTYLFIAGFAVLLREFIATIAFSLVPFLTIQMLLLAIGWVFPQLVQGNIALMFVVMALMSVWVCFYRGKAENLYQARLEERLEERRKRKKNNAR